MLEAVRLMIARAGTTGSDVAYFMALVGYDKNDNNNNSEVLLGAVIHSPDDQWQDLALVY